LKKVSKRLVDLKLPWFAYFTVVLFSMP